MSGNAIFETGMNVDYLLSSALMLLLLLLLLLLLFLLSWFPDLHYPFSNSHSISNILNPARPAPTRINPSNIPQD